MQGLPTSEAQRKYLTAIQTKLGRDINIPKKSKAALKLIKGLLNTKEWKALK